MEYQFQGKQKYNKSLVYSEIVFQCYIIIIIIIIIFCVERPMLHYYNTYQFNNIVCPKTSYYRC